MKCFDCHHETDDFVRESRCTGGESHAFHPTYDYSQVPVCANRRTCKQNQAEDAIRTSQDLLNSQIEALREPVRLMYELLRDPQPGIFTWVEAFQNARAQLRRSL